MYKFESIYSNLYTKKIHSVYWEARVGFSIALNKGFHTNLDLIAVKFSQFLLYLNFSCSILSCPRIQFHTSLLNGRKQSRSLSVCITEMVYKSSCITGSTQFWYYCTNINATFHIFCSSQSKICYISHFLDFCVWIENLIWIILKKL